MTYLICSKQMKFSNVPDMITSSLLSYSLLISFLLYSLSYSSPIHSSPPTPLLPTPLLFSSFPVSPLLLLSLLFSPLVMINILLITGTQRTIKDLVLPPFHQWDPMELLYTTSHQKRQTDRLLQMRCICWTQVANICESHLLHAPRQFC